MRKHKRRKDAISMVKAGAFSDFQRRCFKLAGFKINRECTRVEYRDGRVSIIEPPLFKAW